VHFARPNKSGKSYIFFKRAFKKHGRGTVLITFFGLYRNPDIQEAFRALD
jgi:hypothetical protein